jgi:hypothetical protein
MSVRQCTTVRACLVTLLLVSGCKKSSAVSADFAKVHLAVLHKAVAGDVAEVRSGLPQGAKYLLPVFATGRPPGEDPHGARIALETARNKVQDLRVSKGTFFAVTDASGLVIRDDQEQDALAGHPLLPAFPELQSALVGKYVETRGSLPEASGVRGRSDGQWVAAEPVAASGEVKGLYVTGWSWSSYAYRLEQALAANLRGALAEGQKMPLVYVYVIVDKDIFFAPISPEVNARAIAALAPLGHASASQPVSFELEIAGREFGLAVELTPELGKNVALAVLRSET